LHAFRFLSVFRSPAEGLLKIPSPTRLFVNMSLLDSCWTHWNFREVWYRGVLLKSI